MEITQVYTEKVICNLMIPNIHCINYACWKQEKLKNKTNKQKKPGEMNAFTKHAVFEKGQYNSVYSLVWTILGGIHKKEITWLSQGS